MKEGGGGEPDILGTNSFSSFFGNNGLDLINIS
jgi:hypothetical protein